MGKKANHRRLPGSLEPSRRQKTAAGADHGSIAAGTMVRPVPDSSNRRSPAGSLFEVLAVCSLLLLAVLLIYGQTVHHEFIACDDDVYVSLNSDVINGLTWNGVRWALTTSYAGNWHPLTWLSHMLDVQCYGVHPAPEYWKDPEAGGHHLTNLLLHAASAIVLFLTLRQMTGTFWRSALVAAMFAVHPLHVESVAWIAERKDVLSGLFWMLTMLAYGWYARRPALGRYLLVMCLFALGLMAKPMLVTLPCVLLLLDFWPLGRWHFKSLPAAPTTQPLHRFPSRSIAWLMVEKAPLLAMSAAISIEYAVIQKSAGFMNMMAPVSFGTRFANALISYVAYLSKTIWPSNLAIFYPYAVATDTGSVSWMVWQATIAALALAAITLLVLWKLRRWPYLTVGWFWYLGAMVPVIGLVQVGVQAMADRYTYLPTIGIYVMLIWGITDLATRWSWAGRQVTMAGAAVALLATWTALAANQTAYWKNSVTVFQHAVDVTSNNYFAHNHLGVTYSALGKVEQAGAEFAEAVRTGPTYDAANGNLGGYYLSRGQFDKAVACFQNAVRINPFLGVYRYDLGLAYVNQHKLDEAVTQLRQGVKLSPDYAVMHFVLAKVLLHQKNTRDAMAELREVIRLSPNEVALLNETAWLLATHPDADVRNGAEALNYAKRADQLTGGQNPLVLGTLAAAYAEVGQFAEATQAARKALELATQQQDQSLIKSIKAKIPLYEAGTPFRDSPSSPLPDFLRL
jgi:tetratricopeptide (TPR) repeat protein